MATRVKDLRQIKLTWVQFQEILRKQGSSSGLLPDEEIKEITLMKPKEILIYAEQK